VQQLYVVPRRRLVFAVWLTVLALPILLIDNIPRTEARAAPVSVESVRAVDATTTTEAAATTAPPEPTTVAVAATTTDAPSTTVAPKPKPKLVVVPKSTTTTTTAPKTTTTTTPPNSEEGGATWYDYRPGECAHKTIPKGTTVTVTNLANGATTTCVVTDRGPYGDGRIIDLDRSTFAEIADPSAGVIQVRITW
jgi:rare lipoprotein A (peptidoglycan hydrolase)